MADPTQLMATAARLFGQAAHAMEFARRHHEAGLAILSEIGAGRGGNGAADDLMRVGQLVATCRELGLRMSGDQHVSEKDAAALIGVARTTLASWRQEGRVTYRRMPSGAVQYGLCDLSKFIGSFSRD